MPQPATETPITSLLPASTQLSSLSGTAIPVFDKDDGSAVAIDGDTVKDALQRGNSAYQLPVTGIPKSDLSEGVQGSLAKADTAIQDVSGKADNGDLDALVHEVEKLGYEVPFEAAFDRMPMLGGQPGILFCDGTPTASNKPTNWIDFLDGGYNWTGLPNVEGQHVLDFTNHVDYYGWLNPETNLLEWKH